MTPALRLKEFESDLAKVGVGAPISVRRTEAGWNFTIGATTQIGGFLLWRLIGPQRIELSSEDDGHKFGLPAPVDAEEEFSALVDKAHIASVSVDPRTGDLMLTFDNDLILQVLVTSSGYECWTVHSGGEFLGAGCSGGVV